MSTNEADRRIGARIKARRKERGITQQAIAAELDLSFQQVQKYESGVNRVSTSTLVKIAAILDTTVSYLATGGSEPAPDAHIIDEFAGVHGGVRLATLYVGLSSKARVAVLQAAEAMAA